MMKRLILIMCIFLALPLECFGASNYIVSSTDSKYTYGDFTEDLYALTEKYPDRLSVLCYPWKSRGEKTDICNSRNSWQGVYQQPAGYAHD